MVGSSLRVMKVGGSLFELPDLGRRLGDWLGRQPKGFTILIAGGGTFVEAIREMDRLHGIGEPAAHWLCIDAMGLTAALLKSVLPAATLVDDLAQLRAERQIATSNRRVCVFDPRCFLRNDEPNLPGTRLPASWWVTSDSIAARVAEVLAADELVLLKSRLPSCGSLAETADEGYVDEFLPHFAGRIESVRCVDFRGAGFAEREL